MPTRRAGRVALGRVRARPRSGLLTAAVLVAWAALATAPPTARGQALNPVVAATIEPDSIYVGGLFTLDLWVDLPAAGEVRFPAVLPLPEDIEQREAVDVRSNDGGRSWRATYRLAAWAADSLSIPEVVASVVPESGDEFPIRISAPTLVVSSILPADEASLELRDARPFLRVRGFPWWLLIVAALVLAVAYLWWRRRDAPVLDFGPTGPGQVALRDLERLREEWLAGALPVGQFYDRYEHALRRYARATRRWAPSRSLVGIVAAGDLLSVLRRSTFIRFAHMRSREGGPEAALEIAEGFIRSELEVEEDESEPPDERRPEAGLGVPPTAGAAS